MKFSANIFTLLIAMLCSIGVQGQDITFKEYKLPDIGTIQIPDNMEQKDQATNTNRYANLIFQQKGVNDKKPGVEKNYARVIIGTEELIMPEVDKPLTDAELSRLTSDWKKETVDGLKSVGFNVVAWYGASRVAVNGQNALKCAYLRTGNEGQPNTFVETYKFKQSEKVSIFVVLSYYAGNEKIWKPLMKKAISTFKMAGN